MSASEDPWERMSVEELRAEGERLGLPFARALSQKALLAGIRERAREREAEVARAVSVPEVSESGVGEPEVGLSLGQLFAQARSLARAILAPPAPEPRPRPSASPLAWPEAEGAAPEPIRTLPLARLLASQGHAERALRIYLHLIERAPEDRGLREEAERLAASFREEQLRRILPKAFPEGASGLSLRLIAGGLSVLYRYTEAQLEGALALLRPAQREGAAVLLRVVRIASAVEGGGLSNESHDLRVEGPCGAHSLSAFAPRAGEQSVRYVVSIGLRASPLEGSPWGERFVSMAHASAELQG